MSLKRAGFNFLLPLVFLMLATVLFPWASMAGNSYGNIDGDQDVDLADAILALQVLVGMSPSTPVNLSGDVNGDNKIGLEEAIYAIQEVANLHNHPPELNPIGNKIVDESTELSFSISGVDANGDTLTYSASALPDGATFDPGTKTFSWAPTYSQSGTYNVTFTVSDIENASDSETITITVNDKTPVFTFPEYFPLNIGDWWDFKDDNTGGVGRITVSGNKSIGGSVTKIYQYPNGEREYYTSDSNGLRLHGLYLISDDYTGEIDFNTPMLMMPNNAQIGKVQDSTTSFSVIVFVPGYGNFTLNIDMTTKTTIIGLEDVTTENTTLKDCIKVSIQTMRYLHEPDETEIDPIAYLWFYKGIGVVKESSSEGSGTIIESYVNAVSQSY